MEDSVLIQSLQNGYALEFERSNATQRLRLFLNELLTLMAQVIYSLKSIFSSHYKCSSAFLSVKIPDQKIHIKAVSCWTKRSTLRKLPMFCVSSWQSYPFCCPLRMWPKLFYELFTALHLFVGWWQICPIHFTKVKTLHQNKITTTIFNDIFKSLNNLIMTISFVNNSVCCSLISNGERYEEETFLGRARLETLRSLCKLCPNQILLIRTKCVRTFIEYH